MQNRLKTLTIAGIPMLLLGACASEQAAVAPAPEDRPARWEAVMLPEATDLAQAGEEDAWWTWRRDQALALRGEPGPMLAADQWPEPDRPSLDNPRYISLPSRPETIIYFRRW